MLPMVNAVLAAAPGAALEAAELIQQSSVVQQFTLLAVHQGHDLKEDLGLGQLGVLVDDAVVGERRHHHWPA